MSWRGLGGALLVALACAGATFVALPERLALRPEGLKAPGGLTDRLADAVVRFEARITTIDDPLRGYARMLRVGLARLNPTPSQTAEEPDPPGSPGAVAA